MELVMQGIGGGIVGVALIRIPLLLVALWRQAGYGKRQRRRALEGFRQRVQAAKARRPWHERPDPTVTATFPGIQVVFARSGRTCTWKPSVGSLLELAKKNDVNVRFGCRAGNCGRCLTAIKSGAVSHVVPMDDAPPASSCLMCLSIPTGNLILDA
jgi:ferredoxin